MTQAEYEVLKKQKYQDYKAGKITNYAYIQWKKKNDPSLNGGAAADPQMKPEEFMQLNNQLSKKLSDGEIDVIEYMKLTNKLSNLYYKDKSSLSKAKKELGLDGPLPKDHGLAATTQADEETLKKLTKVYRKAQKEIKAKLKEWQDKYKNDAFELWKKQHNGEITQSEYKTAMEHLAFQGELWNKKLDQVTGVLANANEEALQIINDEKMGVFAENANWQSYQITQDTGMDLSFAIYDQDAVGNLIKNEPQLLPKKKLDTAKDKAWNQKKIAGAVAQGIIQGESIPQLAERIATDTASSNGDAMIRYARTAMTGAQNAGRLHTLQRAEGMGIKCKKCWLATLDGRTRDSHREMDGVKVGVNENFKTPLGSEMLYPGDVSGKAGDVWNCRCTMTYEYDGYPPDPEHNDRIQYDDYYTTYKDKNGKTHKVYHRSGSSLIKDMTYNEWKAAKEHSKLNDLNVAKTELAKAQKYLVEKKINESKVYSGIWKEDVTLADYAAKKASISAKRDYYAAEIDKLENAIANGESWATDEKLKEKKKMLKLLNEFERNGMVVEKRDQALAAVQDIYNQAGYQKTAQAPAVAGPAKKANKTASKAAAASAGPTGGTQAQAAAAAQTGAKKGQFAPDAWDAKTKKAAVYHAYKTEADKQLRPILDKQWDNMTDVEKYAIWQYTENSNPMNKRLSGYGDTSTWARSAFEGFGNTTWGLEDQWRSLYGSMTKFGKNGHPLYHKAITQLTNAIEKAEMPMDIWFKRHGGPGDFAGMMEGGGFDFNSIMKLMDGTHSQKELDAALVGQRGKNNAFTSVCIAKDARWSGNIWYNIYCPKGTKGVYAEPQSHYGHSMGGNDEIYKKGSSYNSIGSEAEVILQRGTEYRITRIKQKGSGRNVQYEIDLEVVAQPDYFVHGDEDTYNNGKTRHKK